MNTLTYILSKLGEVDPNTRLPWEISNVSRLDLLRWIKELDFKVGAEIGVANGEYSQLICDINPQVKLYGIDPWVEYEEYDDYKKKSTFDDMFRHTQKKMRNYILRKRFEIVKKFSMDAVKQFEDNSLDFVYIDANHQAPYVLQDITEWAKKVRPGGIVAGHDYVRIKRVNYAIKESIQKYTKENNITPWFILGTNAMFPGIVREGARSWMFVR